MSYQALARKWRPKTFSEVVGQSDAIRALTNALDSDRLHHAYLFSGTRGVGKTTIGRLFAKCLNCAEGITSKCCGNCNSCRGIDAGGSLDLIEVDAASRTKVEETKELLDNVQYVPTQSRFKIYLIDEIHMFSKHSFNALLKTLEEPPSHVKFLLATTDPDKIPVTILSRCLQFSLKKVSVDVITDQQKRILEKEKLNFDLKALELISRAADGSVRDALSLLDRAIVTGDGSVKLEVTQEMLGVGKAGLIPRLLSALADGKSQELLAFGREIAAQNPNYALVIEDLLQILRRMAVVQLVGNHGVNFEDEQVIVELSKKISPIDCQLYYEILLKGLQNLNLSSNLESAFEMLLIRLVAFRPKEVDGQEKIEIGDVQSETEKTPNEDSKKADYSAISEAEERWDELVRRMSLNGLPRELARNCCLVSDKNGVYILEVAGSHANLVKNKYIEPLSSALQSVVESPISVKVNVVSAGAVKSPAQLEINSKKATERKIIGELDGDPSIKQLKSVFDARLDELILKDK